MTLAHIETPRKTSSSSSHQQREVRTQPQRKSVKKAITTTFSSLGPALHNPFQTLLKNDASPRGIGLQTQAGSASSRRKQTKTKTNFKSNPGAVSSSSSSSSPSTIESKLDIGTVSYCVDGELVVIQDEFGQISDKPDYSALYASNLDCDWLIEPVIPDQASSFVIQLTFLRFDLEPADEAAECAG